MKHQYKLIGLLFDVVDWIGLGMIPIIFDVFDILTMFFWYKQLGTLGLAGVVELIPGADVLPTNVVLGYLKDKELSKRK